VKSDAYEDVKADACYYLGRLEVTIHKPVGAGVRQYQPTLTERNHQAALRYFSRSIELYPRERALVAAARSHMALEEWEQARALLNRALTDFGDGDRVVLEEAKRLMPKVLKAIAEQKAKN
jgi:tetratricopeptide (TPR) repeat protein